MNEPYSLQHYGIPGMKWGVRKGRVYKPRHPKSGRYSNSSSIKKKTNLKRNLAIGVTVATVVLTTYGAYRYSKFIRDKNVGDGH